MTLAKIRELLIGPALQNVGLFSCPDDSRTVVRTVVSFRPVERTVWTFDFVWIDSDQDNFPEYRFLMSWATYF